MKAVAVIKWTIRALVWAALIWAMESTGFNFFLAVGLGVALEAIFLLSSRSWWKNT